MPSLIKPTNAPSRYSSSRSTSGLVSGDGAARAFGGESIEISTHGSVASTAPRNELRCPIEGGSILTVSPSPSRSSAACKSATGTGCPCGDWEVATNALSPSRLRTVFSRPWTPSVRIDWPIKLPSTTAASSMTPHSHTVVQLAECGSHPESHYSDRHVLVISPARPTRPRRPRVAGEAPRREVGAVDEAPPLGKAV